VTLERNDDIRLAEEDAAQAGLDADEPMSDEEQVEVAEIRAEIEETRLEMGGTLNELGDRLEPSHLVEQAKENVREATIGRVEETAKGMSDMVMDTIKRNPIPAALAGAGLAMLWANRSQGSNGHRTMQYGTGYSYGYQDRPVAMYGPNAQASQGIGAKAADVASTVGDTVGSAAETAQQATGEVVSRAGQTVEQVGWKVDRFMQANPLAMGAIAIGAGAVIGSLVPETTHERELLGDASRQVGETVRDTVDQAATKAEETMDRAEEQVTTPA
jgi:flavin-binding protein dodecin